MATNAPTKPKQAEPSKSSEIQATAAAATDLLTRKDFGLHVTGRVDAIDPVAHRQGKSAKGNEYSFWQQSVHVSVGRQMYEIVFRADQRPVGELFKGELDQIQRFAVEKPRVFNGNVSFDAVI